MSSRSLAVLPALLLMSYACGSNIVLDSAGATSTSKSASTGASSANTSSAAAGAGGGVVATGTGGASTIVGSASAGGAGTGGAGIGGAGAGPCTTQQEQARWASMVQAPITLMPANGGNLDVAGPNGMGLTILDAIQIDCQCQGYPPSMGTGGGSGIGGSGVGGSGAAGSGYCQWGNNGEVGASYSTSTLLIDSINLWPGYLGSLKFNSRDGKHSYGIPVQTATIDKDGKNYLLDWNQPGFNQNPAFDAELNELYDAIIATYAPGLPQDNNCQGSGNCVVGNFGDVAYIELPQVGLSIWIASLSAGQPTCSTINRIDLFPH